MVLVIGIGNEYRGDDGAGLVVARRIKELNLPDVRMLEAGGEGAALMEAWQGAEAAILIDAVYSGGTPGTVYRFDARTESIPAKFFHYSTHAFSVAEAIELARALNQLPPRLIVYGIEGLRFDAGVGLSAEVERATQEVVRRALREMSVAV